MSNAHAPAHPSPLQTGRDGDSFYYPGMTKRELIAAMLSASLFSLADICNANKMQDINASAISAADDLLEQLEKTNV